MLDYLIKGGTVVDGTGTPGRVADVAIRDGRVVAIGDGRRAGHRDDRRHRARGVPRLRRPPHPLRRAALLGSDGDAQQPPRRHLDRGRQLRLHAGAGVAGQLGLPARHDGAGRGHGQVGARAGRALGLGQLRRLPRPPRRQPGRQRRVHGRALRAAPPGDGGRLGRPGRRPPSRSTRCGALLGEAIDAGGLGFSTTQSFTHSDGDGDPVPSRWADPDELLALCDEVGAHPGTTLEWVTDGCLKGFSPDEVDLMIEMSRRGRPAHQLERARGRLGRARALPRPARGRGRGRAPRRQGRGPDHADPRGHEHELPHLLRPLPAAGLGPGPDAAGARAHGSAWPIPRPGS